ncbi:MAG TPA: hypothetical protein VIJ63_00180 [Roseiarcus sp.]
MRSCDSPRSGSCCESYAFKYNVRGQTLKGQKIATVYHDSGYGRDTIELLATLAKKYGFEDIEIPVPHPAEQQQAARVGFPADHIIGDIWSGSEEDVRPAGGAAKGYLAVSVFPSGTDFKVSQILKKDVIDAGKGDLKDQSKFGSVYYNAGLVTAIIYTEALRAGHKKLGNHPLTSELGQWALEHLDITPERIAELGATGLFSPLQVTPSDHEGNPAAKIVQWDGKDWQAKTDWLNGDRALFHDAIYAKAAACAKEKNLAPREASTN